MKVKSTIAKITGRCIASMPDNDAAHDRMETIWRCGSEQPRASLVSALDLADLSPLPPPSIHRAHPAGTQTGFTA